MKMASMNHHQKISNFRGLSWIPHKQKWRARVTISNKTISLGYFVNEKSAAEKIDDYIKNHTSNIKLKRKLNLSNETIAGNKSKIKKNIKVPAVINIENNTDIIPNDSIEQSSSSNQTNMRSLLKGVSWHRPLQKWVSRITIKGKQLHLGYFDSEIEASMKYNEFATAAGRTLRK